MAGCRSNRMAGDKTRGQWCARWHPLQHVRAWSASGSWIDECMHACPECFRCSDPSCWSIKSRRTRMQPSIDIICRRSIGPRIRRVRTIAIVNAYAYVDVYVHVDVG